MAYPLRSIDDLLANTASMGEHRVAFHMATGTLTAANATSGFMTESRSGAYTLPTMTSPCTGAYLTYARAIGAYQGPVQVGLEKDLGTLTISGNAFSGGAAMPTRKLSGATAAQLVSHDPRLVVSTVLSATTPTITITYRNQDGTGSRTATLTLPTSPAVGSSFRFQPLLQSGDTGITEVTNISTSGGTSGVLKVYGFVPCYTSVPPSTAVHCGLNVTAVARANVRFESGDIVGFYRFSNAAGGTIVALCFSPDDT
jgi:hypothetical protein